MGTQIESEEAKLNEVAQDRALWWASLLPALHLQTRLTMFSLDPPPPPRAIN